MKLKYMTIDVRWLGKLTWVYILMLIRSSYVYFKPYKNKHTIKLIRQLKRNTKRYGRSPVYHSFGVFKIFSSCSMHNIHYSFFNMAWHNLGGGLLLPRSKVMMFRTQHPSFSTHFLEWTNLGGQSQFAIDKVVYSTRHW